ncbi:MAG: hypothetical protein GF344_04535 [Chitinivibrionales bacterium]|nr:hypothetical protein [Chitinivibrionales bacterium]
MAGSRIRQLGRHSLIYLLGDVLTLAAGFILIPIYTNRLDPGQYGILELLNRTGEVIMMVALRDFIQAYIRFFLDKDDLA